MSGLALYLQKEGFFVSGSDMAESSQTVELRKKGIPIYIGHSAENVIGADVVVCCSAISESNPELCFARERGIPVVGRGELLRLVSKEFPNVIAISGCHGKTTATAMTSHMIIHCTGSVTSHIGGADSVLGNIHISDSPYFVTEACEYEGNFLKLDPSVAVVLNTDADHMEYYKTEENLLAAYREFIKKAKAGIVCADDRICGMCKSDLTFGLSEGSDITAEEITNLKGKFSFRLCAFGKKYDRIKLNAYGRHNIYNALAAAAVGIYYAFPMEMICEGIEKFEGISRRFEWIGKFNGAEFIADYAHHPQEITAALETARQISREGLKVIFQPHTYSRTRIFMQNFVNAFKDEKNLVIYRTYPAREYFDAEGSALTLSEKLPRSLYIETLRELVLWLERTVKPGDTVLFLGAGDIYYAAKMALEQLRKR